MSVVQTMMVIPRFLSPLYCGSAGLPVKYTCCRRPLIPFPPAPTMPEMTPRERREMKGTMP